MDFSRSAKCSAIALLLLPSLSAAPTQDKGSGPTQEADVSQNESLKAISTPMAIYPGEAAIKGIEGRGMLSMVADAKGNVSEATALSGPAELIPTAIAAVRKWKFEPPAHPPVTKAVEISFSFPKECPGPGSDAGEVEGSGRLFNQNGQLVAVVDADDYPLPPYPEAERKAGITGKMVLSITLNSDGTVKKIAVIKSLSPSLDNAAANTVRPLKFRRVDSNPAASLRDLRLQFAFRAVCHAAPD